MVTTNKQKHYVRGWGKLPLIASARFTANNGADPTVVKALGIASITRTGEGAYTVVLDSTQNDVLATGFPFMIMAVRFSGVEATAGALDHNYIVKSVTESTGTITLVHEQVTDVSAAAYAADDGDASITFFTLEVYMLEAP